MKVEMNDMEMHIAHRALDRYIAENVGWLREWAEKLKERLPRPQDVITAVAEAAERERREGTTQERWEFE